MEEFSQIAKCELELLVLNEVISTSEGQTAEMEKAVEAVKGGVRLSRTASTTANKKLQGDLDMLTAESIQARQDLKNDDIFSCLVHEWWHSIEMKEGEGTLSRMGKEAYLVLNTSLHKKFVPDVTNEEARAAAELDWEQDLGPSETMGFGESLQNIGPSSHHTRVREPDL
jgi:hypothetical protein